MAATEESNKEGGHMARSLDAGLEGRAVIVTGAAGGIGRAVVDAFLSAGACVVAVDHPDAPDAGLSDIARDECKYIPCDLRASGSDRTLVEEAERAFGSLYGLVHLAAILRRRDRMADVTEEDWNVQLDTNLKSTFFLCRSAAEAMARAGCGGRVITFSSQGWWSGGFGGSVVYSASKGGIVSMTRGFARTYGPVGVTFNAIAPGQVRTTMLLRDLREDVLRSMTEATPLGRIAEPEEVAGIAVFLASQHAGFITGATINISGGLLMY